MTTRTKLAAAAIGVGAIASGPATIAAATYTVKPGDTLSAIAKKHGTSVAALAQANGIANANRVRIGQLLNIPDTRGGLPGYTSTATDSEAYTVQAGDGLLHIAQTFGIDAASLAQANHLTLRSHLHVGQQLQVPGRLERINALLTSTAQQVGVDPKLVRAVAWMESGWKQNVTSRTGAIGIMQIEPYTADWIAQRLAGRSLDVHTAADNVYAGALLIKHLLTAHAGDVNAALAAYYQGDLSITQHGLFTDTKQYQKVVTTLIGRE